MTNQIKQQELRSPSHTQPKDCYSHVIFKVSRDFPSHLPSRIHDSNHLPLSSKTCCGTVFDFSIYRIKNMQRLLLKDRILIIQTTYICPVYPGDETSTCFYCALIQTVYYSCFRLTFIFPVSNSLKIFFFPSQPVRIIIQRLHIFY